MPFTTLLNWTLLSAEIRNPPLHALASSTRPPPLQAHHRTHLPPLPLRRPRPPHAHLPRVRRRPPRHRHPPPAKTPPPPHARRTALYSPSSPPPSSSPPSSSTSSSSATPSKPAPSSPKNPPAPPTSSSSSTAPASPSTRAPTTSPSTPPALHPAPAPTSTFLTSPATAGPSPSPDGPLATLSYSAITSRMDPSPSLTATSRTRMTPLTAEQLATTFSAIKAPIDPQSTDELLQLLQSAAPKRRPFELPSNPSPPPPDHLTHWNSGRPHHQPLRRDPSRLLLTSQRPALRAPLVPHRAAHAPPSSHPRPRQRHLPRRPMLAIAAAATFSPIPQTIHRTPPTPPAARHTPPLFPFPHPYSNRDVSLYQLVLHKRHLPSCHTIEEIIPPYAKGPP